MERGKSNMEMQDWFDKFELEYDYYTSDNVGVIERTYKMVYRTLGEIDANKKALSVARRLNKRQALMSRILGKNATRYGYFNSRYYEVDNVYIGYQRHILKSLESQVNSIHQVIDYDNYGELCRLLCFVIDKNKYFISSIKRERQDINLEEETNISGIPQCREEAVMLNNWFGEMLVKSSSIQRVVKEKK